MTGNDEVLASLNGHELTTLRKWLEYPGGKLTLGRVTFEKVRVSVTDSTSVSLMITTRSITPADVTGKVDQA